MIILGRVVPTEVVIISVCNPEDLLVFSPVTVLTIKTNNQDKSLSTATERAGFMRVWSAINVCLTIHDQPTFVQCSLLPTRDCSPSSAGSRRSRSLADTVTRWRRSIRKCPAMSVCDLLTELLPEKTRARVGPSSAKQTSSSSGTQGEDCKQWDGTSPNLDCPLVSC